MSSSASFHTNNHIYWASFFEWVCMCWLQLAIELVYTWREKTIAGGRKKERQEINKLNRPAQGARKKRQCEKTRRVELTWIKVELHVISDLTKYHSCVFIDVVHVHVVWAGASDLSGHTWVQHRDLSSECCRLRENVERDMKGRRKRERAASQSLGHSRSSQSAILLSVAVLLLEGHWKHLVCSGSLSLSHDLSKSGGERERGRERKKRQVVKIACTEKKK